MGIIEKIQMVIDSSLLSRSLVYVPNFGASDAMLEDAERVLGRKLSLFHRELLKKWNGLDLDIIRFYGCGCNPGPHGSLAENQFELPEVFSSGLVIGSDPAGFLYVEDETGQIFMIDSEGGEISYLATSLNEFICSYVFGERGHEFAGEGWLTELEHNNLL